MLTPMSDPPSEGIPRACDAETSPTAAASDDRCIHHSGERAEPVPASGVQAAADPGCDPETLARLFAGEPSTETHQLIAAHPRCPLSTLAQASASPYPTVRLAAAANPSAPAAVLEALLLDTDAEVRAAAAANPGCAPGLAEAALRSADPGQRNTIAADPRSPAVLLAVLGSDPDATIRFKVASNPSCLAETLPRLGSDSDPSVRARCCCQPVLPGAHARSFGS